MKMQVQHSGGRGWGGEGRIPPKSDGTGTLAGMVHECPRVATCST